MLVLRRLLTYFKVFHCGFIDIGHTKVKNKPRIHVCQLLAETGIWSLSNFRRSER